MSDTITQMRLSLRLDTYLTAYTEKNRGKNTLSGEEWDTAWQLASVARTENHLTPEIVDDVRIVLNKQ